MTFGNQILEFKKLFSNLQQMMAIAWKMDSRLVLGYYTTAALGALAPVIAGLTVKYLIDQLQVSISNSNLTTIPMIIIFILAGRYLTVLLWDILKYGLNNTYYDYLFRYKLQNEFSKLFVDKVSSLDIPHLENTNTQNLLTKARDTLGWREPDFLRMFRYLFENFVSFLGAFIILVPYGFWIPVLITAISLPRLIFRVRYGTLEWSVWDSLAPESRMRWYLMYLVTGISAIREMRIFQTQKALFKKFMDIQNHLLETQMKPLNNYLKFLILPSFIEGALLFVVASFLLPEVLKGSISIGSFTLIITMIDALNQAANGIVGNFADVYGHNLYVQYFLDIMSLPKLITSPKDPIKIDSQKPPKIEFKNVYFKYTDHNVLKDVSFTVNPGERVALVGTNGAGKSTIVKLLCRFYEPSEGEILINDVDLKKIDLETWYKCLGTLFQDFVDYHFTVKENIQLSGGEKVDLEKTKKAAKLSGASEFIEKLKEGYNQQLGREFDNGEELSAGQWQKLAIARAFYEGAPVLILDEPTSAIDAEAEYEIFNNLEKHYAHKTLIFVSHRFSTVRNADRIFVIDDGSIIEEGTHQELMRKNDKYAHMFKLQAEGYR